MKKQLLSLVAVGAMSGSLLAQLPASTVAANKNAVLTEYTGVYCGYCPDGHKIATNLYNADPTHVVLINDHCGGYATVAVGEPDFTTPEGSSISTMATMNILGYPAGDVNRTIIASAAQQTASPYGMAQNRNYWSSSFTTTKAQAAYCNVAVQGTIDVVTRVLTVQAQVYYTANAPVGSNSLTVVLKESKVTGPQHDYGNYNPTNWNPDGSYNHNHALRKALSPTFGTQISTTTAGTTFNMTYTYTIPATYGVAGKTTPALLGNMELSAFVTETNVKTIQGANGPIVLTGFANSLDVAATSLSTDASVCSGINMKGSFKFTNNGSSPVTSIVYTYAMNGGAPTNVTYTPTSAINPFQQSLTINLPNFTFSPIASNTVDINILSVNGSADQNPSNNTAQKTGIGLTSTIANSMNMQMDFTQDQWGSEDSWKVYDEVLGTVISQDGPFTDLAAVGTVLHTKLFTVNPNTCYKLVVSDAYGDGVNSGYGVGGYILKSGGVNMIVSNGQYGSGETKLYKTSGSVGIYAPQMSIGGINVYPNPTSSSTNLSIDLIQNENVSVTVLNSVGQEVYASKNNSYDAGVNTIQLNTENWAAGVYNINISTAKGSVNHKLTVTK